MAKENVFNKLVNKMMGRAKPGEAFDAGFKDTFYSSPSMPNTGPVKFPSASYYPAYPPFGNTRNGYNWYLQLPNTNINYQEKVGDPLLNSVVAASIFWLARNLPEAKLQVTKADENDLYQKIKNHPMAKLIARPNSTYTYAAIMAGLAISWYVDGNVYLYKRRDKGGKVKELYYFPHWAFEPRWNENDPNEFIDYYDYVAHGARVRVEKTEIVHLRNGIDPENTRKGLSPMKSILREIFQDNETTAFGAALISNFGIPSYIISPSDKDNEIEDDYAETIKETFSNKFGGDHRGEPMVSTTGLKLDKIGFTPAELDLKMLHRLPEERITAVIGIPAIVLGLGVGLEHATMANFSEAREMAYESNIIPTQTAVAEQLYYQLLPDFETDISEFDVIFDLSTVRVLQADDAAKATRWDIMVRGGWAKVGEARSANNLKVGPEDDIYLRPIDPNSEQAFKNEAKYAPKPAPGIQAPGAAPKPRGGSNPGGKRPSVPRAAGGDNSVERARRTDARQRTTVNPKTAKDFEDDEIEFETQYDFEQSTIQELELPIVEYEDEIEEN
jgi:HK97 family phage portal protein